MMAGQVALLGVAVTLGVIYLTWSQFQVPTRPHPPWSRVEGKS
jgi:hypothetical protein